MTRLFANVAFASVLCVAIALCAWPVLLNAQTSPVDQLAARAAEKVAETHRQHILVAGLLNCQLDMELCTAFENSFRSSAEKVTPGVQFIMRENVISLLVSHGFLSVDAYINDVLKGVSSQAGAEILVTSTLHWEHDGYDLAVEIFDVAKAKKLNQFQAKIPRTVPDSSGIPLIFKDPDSGVSLALIGSAPSNHAADVHPTCERCPDPRYTPQARTDRIQGTVLMLMTVTEQGLPEHISVIQGLGDGLTNEAVDTVRSWHFKPAMGPDGKPFAMRVPTQITFRLN